MRITTVWLLVLTLRCCTNHSAASSPTSRTLEADPSTSTDTTRTTATSGMVTSVTSSTHSTPTPAASVSTSSGSNTWIAGAVVGPIAGLALLALAFWLGRHLTKRSSLSKSRARQHETEEGKDALPVADQGDGPNEVESHNLPAELLTVSNRHELKAGSRPAELSTHYRSYELP